MLRPEKMSKVSVTGSKRVMDEVIETVHDQNLLHVTDYDGSWEGFDPGDPIGDAEEASNTLVTVRSIESILDVDEADVDSADLPQHVDAEAVEAELEPIREQVNELDDERGELRDERRDVEDRLEAMAPFVDLGIDLDLLSGYDTLEVSVGEGKEEAVRRALVESGDVDAFEIFTGDGDVLAVFARPVEGADDGVLADVLVGAEFSALDVPSVEDESTTPSAYVDHLEERKNQLDAEIARVESELEELKVEAAEFLLAAEEELSIRVQKTEAPLSFATTENAFIAEGWIPNEQYMDFAEALRDSVGQHVDVDRLEVAEYTRSGAHHEHTDHGEAAADGGTVMAEDDPPVVMDNPGLFKPFEVLTKAVSRPKYEEFDPTVVLFLTFPAFFGFMIGDLGYGALYTAIGWYLYTNFDSEGFRSMGGVTIFAGIFTMLFGVLYGEIFGTHQVTKVLWEGVFHMHGPPIEKGLSPATVEWAKAWLVISVLVGIVHLNIGWGLDFVENLQIHDAKHALLESASWILMMNGLWIWVFSDSARAMKPEFLFETFGGAPFALGFGGFSAGVGLAGAGVFFLGLVMLFAGEPIEVVEFLNVLVNVLSYTRIAAVLLAKAGMAFTVNLLFFGAYVEKGHFHFMYSGHPHGEVLFGGLMHGGVAMLLVGILVLVLGHLLVLALGVTSAGLQAVRLEYVEFFGKFYQGGGDEYEPFGYERRFTSEN